MGAIALIRQTYYDAQWYINGGYKKEYNISLDAWNKIQDLPQVFEAGDKQNELRADKIGDEFGVKYIIKGNGEEYQRISEIKLGAKDGFIHDLAWHPQGYIIAVTSGQPGNGKVAFLRPGDKAAKLMIDRCLRYRLHPPPNWDGVSN